MIEHYRRYLADFAGTFVLVLFSAGAVCSYWLPNDSRPEPAGVAMAQGYTLAVLLTATTWKTPGGFNPALTLIFYIFKRLEGRHALVLIGVQLLGAVLAGLVLRSLFSLEVLRDARIGTPHLKAFLDPGGTITLGALLSGCALEITFTAFLTFAYFGAFFDPKAARLGGLLPGLAQVVIVVLGFHLTGGSANPAVWFGPMLWEYTLPGWESLQPTPLADHVVYWAAPVVGAFLGGLVYSTLILRREP
jgi:glycerol uptake facilitator protein